MTFNKYNRGSEWKKWDLHIHSEYSQENNAKLKIIDIFSKSIEKGLNVISITDHTNVDALDKIWEVWENEKILIDDKENFIKDKIDFLPGIELKTDKGNKGVHVIVIFPKYINETKIDKKYLKEEFLSQIECTENKIKEAGDGDYKKGLFAKDVDFEEMSEKVRAIGGLIIVHAGMKDRGLETEIGHENNQNDNYEILNSLGKRKEELMKKCIDICEVQNWEKGNQEEAKFYFKNFSKPTILSSDSHDDIKGDKFTWIKADPTFEGLKQIIYEPEERVKIQEKNPEFEFDKPFFDGIELSEQLNVFENIQDQTQQVYFEKTKLLLNKNLIAIIGGRGEGKSLLVNYFANIFNKFEINEAKDEFSKSGNFKVTYSKNNIELPDKEQFFGSEENELDFLFISQNKLKKLSEEKSVGQEIKKLLNLEDLKFDTGLNIKIKENIDDIKSMKDWFEERDEDGDLYHNKEFVNKFKIRNEKLIQNITTKENKEKLSKYTDNIKQIQNIDVIIGKLFSLKDSLLTAENNFKKEISKLNDSFEDGEKIEEINFKIQIGQMEKNISCYQNRKGIKEKENNDIKKQFEKEGFSGDLSALLNNAGNYQRNVEWAENKLKKIDENSNRLNNLLKIRDNFGDIIKKEYERQEKIITNTWKKIIDQIEDEEHKHLMETILADRDIQISGEIIFDQCKFYSMLKDYIDMRSFTSVKNNINIKNIEDFSNFINTKLSSYVEGDQEDKTKENLEELFFDLQKRKEFLYTQPKITYKGKPLYRLSAGQRGTVYLCLKLATGAFSKPIIFDQPEDDLDNEFIISELIDIFKKLKKYRQIIILTHNANLVVNADAEQVIVAKNNDEKLSYFSGALENIDIIKSVCSILEGGKLAFQQRKNKYNFIK